MSIVCKKYRVLSKVIEKFLETIRRELNQPKNQ